MNRQYLENLENAKESLKIWISNLEQKNLGNQMFSSEIEIDKNKTDFAIWYYGEGQTFSSFETFRNIESHYHSMFDRFLEYNYLNKQPIKRGFFTNNTEKRKESLNNIFKKIRSGYDRLQKQVDFFQNTLIESPLFANSSVVEKLQEDESHESDIAFDYSDQFAESNTPKSVDVGVDSEPDTDLEFKDVDDFIEQELAKREETVSSEQEPHAEFKDGGEIVSEEPPKIDETNDELDVKTTFEIDKTNEIEEIASAKTEEFLSTNIEEIESEVAEEIANEDRISNQTEEKRAVLESTNKPTDKLKKEYNIQPEMDIEEEIRRILS